MRYSEDKAVRSKYQQGLKHLLYGSHLLYNTITLAEIFIIRNNKNRKNVKF